MKIVFHPKFYTVYTSDPAAEAGRMEAIMEELRDYEVVEPEPAKIEDILSFTRGSTTCTSKASLRFMKLRFSPLAERFLRRK
ncbi:hypothetical protein [Archaeoglobus fulgidus]|uniref:hypothetical protein n=1 Tax=Archaeoglobus fulgidus TaxID=2234 RepID=UPI001FCC93F1|nr:hypothetical protein [Archaeoglobus fulgidus]